MKNPNSYRDEITNLYDTDLWASDNAIDDPLAIYGTEGGEPVTVLAAMEHHNYEERQWRASQVTPTSKVRTRPVPWWALAFAAFIGMLINTGVM